jgi:hypothetical protein
VFLQQNFQITKLTVVFVLVLGMMFLVPVITGKALGETLAQVFRTNVDFTGKTYYLDAGVFVNSPPSDAFNNDKVYWSTTGTGFYGDEKGYVQYHVQDKNKNDLGTVTFEFSNPAKGTNTCSVRGSPGIATKCSITQGVHATLNYCVWYNSAGPTNCPVATSHSVLEKKPISSVQTPSSGKIGLLHNQSPISQSGSGSHNLQSK